MTRKNSSPGPTIPRLNTQQQRAVRQVSGWMKSTDRTPFPFQRRVWKSILTGESGILHSPTGTGKTLAVWLGAIADWLSHLDASGIELPQTKSSSVQEPANPPKKRTRRKRGQRSSASAIRVLWLTPLRALAADTQTSLEEPVRDLGLPWTIERRTSDTSSTLKAKQRQRLPTCLITTPESLSLLLSYRETAKQLPSIQLVVLDEWHELMASKRGVQTELCLAHLRQLNPHLQTWALSATIGNVSQAMHTALGRSEDGSSNEGNIVRAPSRRKTALQSLIPDCIERFPWAGHMGLKSLPAVLTAIEEAASTLVFTNTRSQAEKWYAAILAARTDWAGKIAVHHGSLDRTKRKWVEEQLHAGSLRAVVCTSSLDLGVDFFPVDQVVQVGSPKGMARLLQRAGRSGHFPGGKSKIVFAPTHAHWNL